MLGKSKDIKPYSGLNVCTSWLDGYYLLTNTTLSGSTLSFWVPDWSLADPRYTNNPLTMSCQCEIYLTKLFRLRRWMHIM